jgi:asparagine synthase (glutamine-hydrolysing)
MLSPETFRLGMEQLNIFDNIALDCKNFDQKKLSIMYLEIKYYLCSKILRDSDWASMAHSVEMRMPFVDWFFLKKLLPLIKSNVDIKKTNLLDCFQNKIPSDLYNRKKTGFGIPYKSFFEKLSNKKTSYSHPIKDWSIFSYKKYIDNEKN